MGSVLIVSQLKTPHTNSPNNLRRVTPASVPSHADFSAFVRSFSAVGRLPNRVHSYGCFSCVSMFYHVSCRYLSNVVAKMHLFDFMISYCGVFVVH